jgi:hypothetical protein
MLRLDLNFGHDSLKRLRKHTDDDILFQFKSEFKEHWFRNYVGRVYRKKW